MRTGIGIDSHAFSAGRALILGGVEIPYERGLAGHSDADVLTHAVIDALLGAAGLGDIGLHFPDTDAEFKDADSLVLLATVLARVRDAGAVNVRAPTGDGMGFVWRGEGVPALAVATVTPV